MTHTALLINIYTSTEIQKRDHKDPFFSSYIQHFHFLKNHVLYTVVMAIEKDYFLNEPEPKHHIALPGQPAQTVLDIY